MIFSDQTPDSTFEPGTDQGVPQSETPTLEQFNEAFGESFEDALNLDTWHTELGLIENVTHIEAQVVAAVAIATTTAR